MEQRTLKTPTILFRKTLAEEGEFEICGKYFNVVEQRTEPRSSLIIGRYSVLPYYKELELDLRNNNCELINTYQQYSYVSKISWWYPDFEDLTPKTWFDLSLVPDDEGPFVLKGDINSRKHLWKTHMFAENKRQACDVMGKLFDDTLISHQQVVIRKYEPLVNYGTDLVGIPISKEFRVFVLYGQVASIGYYWSVHQEDIKDNIDPSQIPKQFLDTIISRVGNRCNFYTVDVAQKQNGEWIIIEMGDAQMAGLSCNNPDILYGNMKQILEDKI